MKNEIYRFNVNENTEIIQLKNKQDRNTGTPSNEGTSVVIIIIKRGWQCKAGRERLTSYQSKDPNPTTPTRRKKEEKGKTVGDKK